MASNISYLRERGRQKFGERLGVGSAFAVLRVLSPLGRRAEANPFVALAAIKQVVVGDGHPRILKNSQNEGLDRLIAAICQLLDQPPQCAADADLNDDAVITCSARVLSLARPRGR